MPIRILLQKSLHCLLTQCNQQKKKNCTIYQATNYFSKYILQRICWELRNEFLQCFSPSHFTIWGSRPHLSESKVASGLIDFSLNSFVLLEFQQTLLLVNTWCHPQKNTVGYFLFLLTLYHKNFYQCLLAQISFLTCSSHPRCSSTYLFWLRGFVIVAF